MPTVKRKQFPSAYAINSERKLQKQKNQVKAYIIPVYVYIICINIFITNS